MTTSSRITLDCSLKTLAVDTWENLREAKILSVRFGEETVTDILMLELRRKGFETFKQTRLHDEAKYGTDFECWVGFDGIGWVGYAVQAKKLDFRTGTYRGLSHVVKGVNQRQVAILKGYANTRGLTPRYCLYSHSSPVDPRFLSCCSRSFDEGELGCTMTKPSRVEQAIATRGGKSFSSLQEHEATVPWRCLAICPRLRTSLESKSVPSRVRSPLLDMDSVIHPRLPDDLVGLRDGDEGEVDFEQLGIGVESEAMDYGGETTPRFIVPRRVFILELLADG